MPGGVRVAPPQQEHLTAPCPAAPPPPHPTNLCSHTPTSGTSTGTRLCLTARVRARDGGGVRTGPAPCLAGGGRHAADGHASRGTRGGARTAAGCGPRERRSGHDRAGRGGLGGGRRVDRARPSRARAAPRTDPPGAPFLSRDAADCGARSSDRCGFPPIIPVRRQSDDRLSYPPLKPRYCRWVHSGRVIPNVI
mgnify:CR=1 FL=1